MSLVQGIKFKMDNRYAIYIPSYKIELSYTYCIQNLHNDNWNRDYNQLLPYISEIINIYIAKSIVDEIMSLRARMDDICRHELIDDNLYEEYLREFRSKLPLLGLH